MKRAKGVVSGAVAALALGVLLSAGSVQAADAVRVSSKLDAESGLLGTMILQVLEANNIPTENKIQLGPTKIVRSALLAGEIDVYPEYTGNGAFFFNVDSDPVWKNAAGGYETVKQLDLDKNNIVWLKPAPANNTWAIALRRDVAAPNKLATMEDFARWVGAGGKAKIAASAEFVESPAALPSFQSTYGFALKPDQILVLAGGDTAATIRAAAEGTSGVNTAMVYGTDGAIAALDLVVMKDTKSAQMVYEPAPTVRASVLQAYPKMREALEPVFASLDEETLRSLNAKISVEGQDPKQVASAYLKSKGFVK
ncbi:glycine betaine ABC transporter substrate-binding protein OsmF [Azospirillum rugosum]|uniref:Osmoprotectant transport system substrate-binding protein n=1 Tax=Azospirillum rugosum TaxID=416170 RepID=A0ABS4SEL5_9PROT|nr:ABC transporter substrate-binding protein [Azospirillum rugosum]MBP2290840.1 osmoprotectant transport system substrate-binding protein [Azospirillum rugosum]MDQ0529707.1 osmoprotectant transport system substrate-binding protein [Azospirillum rugosum]